MNTLREAICYATGLVKASRFEEAKSLLRTPVPVARRVLGDTHDHTLRMREIYARALCYDPAATLDDLREAVNTLEDIERIARRVFGSANPLTVGIGHHLQVTQAVLRARSAAP